MMKRHTFVVILISVLLFPFCSVAAVRHRAPGVRLSRLHVGTDPGELLSDPVCDIRYLRCLSVPAPVLSSGKYIMLSNSNTLFDQTVSHESVAEHEQQIVVKPLSRFYVLACYACCAPRARHHQVIT